jgi:dimethylargininase
MFTHAIVRKPGIDFASGITTANLGKPSFDLMRKQHQAYGATLRSLGLEVEILEPLPGYPDAYFVEDVAVITPDIAVIARPGALTRRGEEISIEPVLEKYRSIARIQSPGTLDGGDVLMVGRHFFIGISERTNRDGAEQIGRFLEEHGNIWTPIPVNAGLHLKSSLNWVGDKTLLISKSFARRAEFTGYDLLLLNEDEEYAGNTLLVNQALLTPKGFPKTLEMLKKLSRPVIELEMSEVRKMDGGLTCLSLRF